MVFRGIIFFNRTLIYVLGVVVFLLLPQISEAASVAVDGKALVTNTSNSYLNFTDTYSANVAVDNVTGNFSGYAYLEDVGWVDFGNTDNPAGPVNVNLSSGAVTGTAYVLNTGADLDFDSYNSNVAINLTTGVFSGYGFSEDVGWINFADTGVATASTLVAEVVSSGSVAESGDNTFGGPIISADNDIADQAGIGLDQGSVGGATEEARRTIVVSPNQIINVTAKPVDSDQLHSLTIKFNGQTYNLTDSDGNLVYVATLTMPNIVGSYSYTLTADYGVTTRSEKGIFLVQANTTSTTDSSIIITSSIPSISLGTPYYTDNLINFIPNLDVSEINIIPQEDPDQDLTGAISPVGIEEITNIAGPTIFSVVGNGVNNVFVAIKEVVSNTVTTHTVRLITKTATGTVRVLTATIRAGVTSVDSGMRRVTADIQLITKTTTKAMSATVSGTWQLAKMVGISTGRLIASIFTFSAPNIANSWSNATNQIAQTSKTAKDSVVTTTSNAYQASLQQTNNQLVQTQRNSQTAWQNTKDTYQNSKNSVTDQAQRFKHDEKEKVPDYLKDHMYEEVNVLIADNEGTPLAGAFVTLASDPQTSIADRRGLATFRNVTTGEHTLTIAYGKYESKQKLLLAYDVPKVLVNVSFNMVEGVSWWVYVLSMLVAIAIIAVLIYLLIKKQY